MGINNKNDYHKKFEHKTLMVVFITAATMVIEIIYGIGTKSMALLADGIHMGSHVLAIGLSWLAYIFLRKASDKKNYSGEPEKILSLSGYSSGIILLMFAFVILWEAVQRIVHPHEIIYKEAIIVATIGLVINIISAFLLHHDQEHSDHNIKAAYLHVLADALTSLSAIAGLIIAMLWNVPFIDSIAAIISAIVIIKWSIGLLKNTGKSLLDIN